jgi:hypothetical protein
MAQESRMKKARPLPQTVAQWLQEIEAAIQDAREAKPFAVLTGRSLTDADLFHLAPLVCLKFRGHNLRGKEARRVTEGALANYVVNSDPEGTDKGLQSKPKLAFALCYVAAHLVLDLLDEKKAEQIMCYCEERLDVQHG